MIYLIFSLLIFTVFCQDSVSNNKLITLEENNFARIVGVIDQSSSSKFMIDISHVTSDKIYIYIASNGGSVLEGQRIIQTIEALQKSGKTVYCIADHAYSMAFAILQSCQHRYITHQSSVMQHQMSSTIKGSLENMKKMIDFLDRVNTIMADQESKRIGISQHEFLDNINNDWWLYGQDIIDNNIADEVVNVICSSQLTQKSFEENIHLIFAEVNFVWSSCPLIKQPLKVNIKMLKDNENDIRKIINDIRFEESQKL